MLQELAQAGEGTYFNLLSGSSQVAEALKTRIGDIERREFEQRVFSQYESYFQYFLAIGLLFLLVEFLLPYKKSKYFGNTDLFK